MSEHKKMFKEYMFTFIALLLLCVCYSINLSVVSPTINESSHYKTFINKTIEKGQLNTYIDSSKINKEDINYLTEELLQIGSFQRDNPTISPSWFNHYRLALAKSLYDINKNNHTFIDSEDLKNMSININVLTVKSFVKLNFLSFTALLTSFSTLSFCFIYLLNYHVMHRYSKYDNRLPYPIFSIDYFLLSEDTIKRYQNTFKVELMILSFLTVLILNTAVYPPFLVF